MKRTINKLFSVISVLIIFISVVLLTVSIAPRFMGLKGYCVLTESMEPTIKKGSLVFAEKVSFDEIEIDNVLVFRDEGGDTGFTHRVTAIDKEKKLITTKGDAGNTEDLYPTGYEYVAGRVVNKIPLLGYITMFLNETYGKITVAAVYVIWIAVAAEAHRAEKRRVSQ